MPQTKGFRQGTAEASQLVYYIPVTFGIVAVFLALCPSNMRYCLTDKILVRSKTRRPDEAAGEEVLNETYDMIGRL